ncbi:hypothetical protein CC79DRAFT_1363669 [Sarocladium strictum]
MAEPLSIVTGCLTLAEAVLGTIMVIDSMTAARQEMRQIRNRLEMTWQWLRHMETGLNLGENGSEVAPDRQDMIVNIVFSCLETLEGVNMELRSCQASMGRMRWVALSRSRVEGLLIQLDKLKSILDSGLATFRANVLDRRFDKLHEAIGFVQQPRESPAEEEQAHLNPPTEYPNIQAGIDGWLDAATDYCTVIGEATEHHVSDRGSFSEHGEDPGIHQPGYEEIHYDELDYESVKLTLSTQLEDPAVLC